MESIERRAVIVTLIRALGQAGSWCGETHVQKAVYMLQRLTGVPTGYDFVLYKHGPFSFALRDELATMRAEHLLELVIRSPDYGPAIMTTSNSTRLEESAKKALAKFEKEIGFVARTVGKRGVAELERLATALLIFQDTPPRATKKDFSRHLIELKPHVSEEDAAKAITEARCLMRSAPRAA